MASSLSVNHSRCWFARLGQPLSQFGVPNALSNPQLALFNQANQRIATNDNWQTTIVDGTIITGNQVAGIQATDKAPPLPNESAILAALPPGNYTAVVSGVSETTGVGLAEVYSLDSGTKTRLRNISTRGFVQTADNVMIGGFIISSQARKVLIWALGPPLTQFGASNALAYSHIIFTTS